MSRQSLFYNKEALCQELRDLMKGMWKDNGEPGYWPWITLSTAQKLNNIAVKCKGQGEQECFKWGRKVIEYYCNFDPDYFWHFERDNPMTLKEHWMNMATRITTRRFWLNVTLPRMADGYVERHRDGKNDYMLEEWAATCLEQGRWINPKEWEEQWKFDHVFDQ